MEIVLLNGETVEIHTKEELFEHFDNCRYPASDAVNARSNGIIDKEEFRKVFLKNLKI